MKFLCSSIAVFIGVVGASTIAQAEPLRGTFTATDTCPAYQSFRKSTNPGDVTTEVGRAYEVIEINKKGGDRYRMRIAEAPGVQERWVRGSCGTFVATAGGGTGGHTGTGGSDTTTARPESTDNLLTVSWQPAFCETKAKKTECKLIQSGGLEDTQTRFSIHGLWPQPNGNFYCGALGKAHKSVDKQGDWHRLPAPDLTSATRDALDALMPGTMSHLDRHEWIKHGTCYFGEDGAEEYFADTLHLMEQLNASPVAVLLAGNLNQRVTGAEIRQAFDHAFGDGAGERVQVNCLYDRDSDRQMIAELWIALKGEIAPDVPLGDLILAANPRSMDCDGGIVDPVGNQR